MLATAAMKLLPGAPVRPLLTQAAGVTDAAPGGTWFLVDGTRVQLSDWLDDKVYTTIHFVGTATAAVAGFRAMRSRRIL
jgi:hypothetical protein